MQAEPEHSSSWILAVWSPMWAVLPLPWDVLVECEACQVCQCPTQSPVISWGSSPQALAVGTCKGAGFLLESWSIVP